MYIYIKLPGIDKFVYTSDIKITLNLVFLRQM